MTLVNMAQNIRLPDLVGGYIDSKEQGMRHGKAHRLRELAKTHGPGLSNMDPAALDAFAREDPTMVADLRYRSKRDLTAAERDRRNFEYRMQRDRVADERAQREFEYRQGRDATADSRADRQFEYQQDRDAAAEERYQSEDAFRREKFGYEKGQDATAAARRKMLDDRSIDQQEYERTFAETSRAVAGLITQVETSQDKPAAYAAAIEQAQKMGLDVTGIPTEYSPEVMGFLRGYYGITAPTTSKPLSPEGKRAYDRALGYDIQEDTSGNVVLADGTQTGLPADDLSEAQSKNIRFTNRMILAEQVLGDVASSGYDPTNFGDVALDQRSWTRWLKSEEGKRWKAAAGEWIVAMIRPDTGAAVTQEEWELYGPIYFPQFGDTPTVMAEKAQKRQTATDSQKLVLGVDVYGQQAPTSSVPPRMGEIRSGYRFLGGDPSLQSNWQAVE